MLSLVLTDKANYRGASQLPGPKCVVENDQVEWRRLCTLERLISGPRNLKRPVLATVSEQGALPYLEIDGVIIRQEHSQTRRQLRWHHICLLRWYAHRWRRRPWSQVR